MGEIIPTRRHLLLAAAASALTAGCVTTGYRHPDEVRLLDPLPGQGLVYLLRAPYDKLHVGVYDRASGALLAALPRAHYTVLSLPPGRHQLLTIRAGLFGRDEPVAPPLDIDLAPDQRLFFTLTAASERTTSLVSLAMTPDGPALVPRGTMVTLRDSYQWTACGELDARGLISISKLEIPRR